MFQNPSGGGTLPRPQTTPQPAMAAAPSPPPDPGPGGDIEQRLAQLTPQDMAALQAAPEAVEVIKRLLPEIAALLDTIVGSGQEAAEEPEEMAPEQPGYALPRPATRLGQA